VLARAAAKGCQRGQKVLKRTGKVSGGGGLMKEGGPSGTRAGPAGTRGRKSITTPNSPALKGQTKAVQKVEGESGLGWCRHLRARVKGLGWETKKLSEKLSENGD